MRARLSLALAIVAVLVTAGGASSATTLPTHVYAPYFETWTTDSLTATAQELGARHFTLAFLETLSKKSCTLAWNGSRSDPVTNGRYLSDIAALRALGGDVILSFGGWAADQRGTEIGDSCKDVNAIAAAYEDLITLYDVTRLDMDIEGRSLRRAAGIDRRNRALSLVQAWAAAEGRPFQLSYTLPTSRAGLQATARAVLQSAIRNGTRVDVVNIMAFDYHDRVKTDMGSAALRAANRLFVQLHNLYPTKTQAELAAMIGITLMPGFDDYPKETERTTVAHAQRVLDYARARGLGTLSIWSIQRDPGRFTQVLQPFTG